MTPINAVFIQGRVDALCRTDSGLEILLLWRDTLAPRHRNWGVVLVHAPATWELLLQEGDTILVHGSLRFDPPSGEDSVHATAFVRIDDDPLCDPAPLLPSSFDPPTVAHSVPLELCPF